MHIKQVTKSQASEELQKLLTSSSGKVHLRAFNHGDVGYTPIEQQEVFSLLGDKIVFAFTQNYETEIKFRPCRGGLIQVEIY